MSKQFLILGGYGNTGVLIAQYLLKEVDCRIILAGRNIAKAQKAVDALHQRGHKNVSAQKVDASNIDTLKSALHNVDMLIVASSTTEYVDIVARAAIETNTDYLDTQLSSHEKLNALKAYENQIKEKGLTFITDGGFHPGVPAVLVRYAALKFDSLRTANVGSIIKLDWKGKEFSQATAIELIDEFKHFDSLIFKDGEWKKSKWSEYKHVKFEGAGTFFCVPMHMLEMESTVRNIPSLQDSGFFVAGFNPLTDYLLMPHIMFWQKIFPNFGKKLNAAMFLWGLQKFNKPPFYTILQLKAEGLKNGAPHKLTCTMRHEDGYNVTAIPVVACILHYLQERKSGLFFQAHYVEPEKFLADCFRMGITIKEKFETEN